MLSLCAVAMVGGAAKAQQNRVCATEEVYKAQVALHPEIKFQEERLKADIDRYISGKMVANPKAKTTFDPSDELVPWPADTTEYHIPIVVHIIYDGSNVNGAAVSVSDNDIYQMVDRLNNYYNGRDPIIGGILNNWKPYIGNPHITFHLATKDPSGKNTHGILREFSYTTNGGDESAKISQWPPNQYLNIYLENFIGRGATKGIVLAYATFPTDYATNPYSQGVISRADQATVTFGGTQYTLAHEIGHYLYLSHTWANNGKEVEDTVCGDDEVDDTPPTYGHFSCGNSKLYDTTCATGYYKDYDSATYYHMTGLTGDFASFSTAGGTNIAYNSADTNILGQTYRTGASSDSVRSISIRVSGGSISGDVTSMSLYNASGTLVANSTNTQSVVAGQTLTYYFANVIQPANTIYKFVVNKVSGGGVFQLDAHASRDTSGMMYRGATANTSDLSKDLYFIVAGRTANIAIDTNASNLRALYKLNGTVNIVGQSFTTGTAGVAVQSIDVYTGNSTIAGDTTYMSIYTMAGGFVSASSPTVINSANEKLTYQFNFPVLSANTSYKFVVNKNPGSAGGVFTLDASTSNPFAGGTMFNGATANTAVPGSDLHFAVNITRLRRIDYPDTTNTQNIMDYSSCNSEMFTKGQVARMRGALRSDVGFRNNLIDTANLHRTGVFDTLSGQFVSRPEINPTALFLASRPFTCVGASPGIVFTNYSYNDTIVSANWNFDKGAVNATSSSLSTVTNSFNEVGWVTASLTVMGNNNPNSDTYTRNNIVYVADPTPVQPYIEDFNPGAESLLDHYPIFNFFSTGNDSYKWELFNGAGFYDKTSIRFKNYDPRDQAAVQSGIATNTATQSPRGLYADFYTPAYDLSGFGSNCFLDFLSAGAYRTNKPSYMNDTLRISYSTDCGLTWNTLGLLARNDLANNGFKDEFYVPGDMAFGDWKEQSFPINPSVRSNQVYFRFRFQAGTDNAYLRYNGLDFGTGNNFYLDRLTVTANPLSVKNGVIVKLGMNVVPNPTSGAATVRLNGGDNTTAEINVTDVTGKVVYHTSVVRKTTTTEVEIPASALSVKGMYLVQVVTTGATETQKLIAY